MSILSRLLQNQKLAKKLTQVQVTRAVPLTRAPLKTVKTAATTSRAL